MRLQRRFPLMCLDVWRESQRSLDTCQEQQGDSKFPFPVRGGQASQTARALLHAMSRAPMIRRSQRGGKRRRGNRAEILRFRAGILSDVLGWRGFSCFLGCAAPIREPLMPNPPNLRVTKQASAECEVQPES